MKLFPIEMHHRYSPAYLLPDISYTTTHKNASNILQANFHPRFAELGPYKEINTLASLMI